MAVDRAGILYVGAVGELGYLRPGEGGALVYESLVDELPAQDREFADVWRILACDEGVFFWTLARLWRRHQGRFHSWEIDSCRIPGIIGGRRFTTEANEYLAIHRLYTAVPLPDATNRPSRPQAPTF